LGWGESEVLSKAKMSDHPNPIKALNHRDALKTLAKLNLTGIKSREFDWYKIEGFAAH
jgi:hypothetical protein